MLGYSQRSTFLHWLESFWLQLLCKYYLGGWIACSSSASDLAHAASAWSCSKSSSSSGVGHGSIVIFIITGRGQVV